MKDLETNEELKNFSINENFNIDKVCPFCPVTPYAYHYKRWYGLLRHVFEQHLRVFSKKRGFEYSWRSRGAPEWKKGDLIYIRIWEIKYSKCYDIEIKNKEECERFLYWYVKDNPSFKGFMRRRK